MERLLNNTNSTRKLFHIVAHMFKWSSISKSPKNCRIPGVLNCQDIAKAKTFWIKVAQQKVSDELQKSTSSSKTLGLHGKFRRLSPFLDSEGIWRIGLRVREYAPFTVDGKPPAFLPHDSKLTKLIMEEAHSKKHSGVVDTVSQFRLMGFWTTKASCLAKAVKSRCVICRYLDRSPMKQIMGGIPRSQLLDQVVWGHVELDLFGPFLCRSDVNKRSSLKVWGMIIVDRNSGALHTDIVMDYSASETIKTLRRFASLRGWPTRIFSDPGSQLESSSGKLSSWFQSMQDQLGNFAADKFEWVVSPANSPWRQGRSEVHIKSIKRLLTIAVGSTKLTPTELQTVLFEAANLSNERPVGIIKKPAEDGSYQVLTPNCLIMGRATNAAIDDMGLTSNLKSSDRYYLVQQVTKEFWQRWASEVTPQYVLRQKWHEDGRDLQVNDVVLIHDASEFKGKYRLGIVETVNLGRDNRVRSCAVGYTLPRVKDPLGQYTGGRRILVTRSVQRLSLLLPVEEQSDRLEVVGFEVKMLNKGENIVGQEVKKDKNHMKIKTLKSRAKIKTLNSHAKIKLVVTW